MIYCTQIQSDICLTSWMLDCCNEAQQFSSELHHKLCSVPYIQSENRSSHSGCDSDTTKHHCVRVVGCQDTAKFMLGMFKLTFKFGAMGWCMKARKTESLL